MLPCLAFLIFCLSPFNIFAESGESKNDAQEVRLFLDAHPYPCHNIDTPEICLLNEAISYMEKGEEKTDQPWDKFDLLAGEVAIHGTATQKKKILAMYDEKSERLKKYVEGLNKSGILSGDIEIPTYGNKVILLLSLNRMDDAIAAAEYRIKNGPMISVSQLPHVRGLWYLVGQNRLDDALEFMRRTKHLRFSQLYEGIIGRRIPSAPMQLLGVLLRAGRERDAKELVESLDSENIYKYVSAHDDPQIYFCIYEAYKKDPEGEARKYFDSHRQEVEMDNSERAVSWRKRRHELEEIYSSSDKESILPRLMRFREIAQKEGKWDTLSYPYRTKPSSPAAQDFLWREYLKTRCFHDVSEYSDFNMSRCILFALQTPLNSNLISNPHSFLREEYAKTLGLTLVRN